MLKGKIVNGPSTFIFVTALFYGPLHQRIPVRFTFENGDGSEEAVSIILGGCERYKGRDDIYEFWGDTQPLPHGRSIPVEGVYNFKTHGGEIEETKPESETD